MKRGTMADNPTSQTISEADPEFDPFIIYGYDPRSGRTVKLMTAPDSVTATHKMFAAIEEYHTRHDPIYLVQVLEVYGDVTLLAEATQD